MKLHDMLISKPDSNGRCSFDECLEAKLYVNVNCMYTYFYFCFTHKQLESLSILGVTYKCFRTPGLFKAPWFLRSSVEVAGPPSAALH